MQKRQKIVAATILLVQKSLFEKTGTRGRGTFYEIKKGNNWANGATKGQ